MRKKDNIFSIILVIVAFLCLVLDIKGQEYEWSAGDFPNSIFLGVYEVEGRYYGAVSNGGLDRFDSNTIYQLSIYELIFSNEDGLNLLEVITIPFEDNYATISLDYIEEANHWIIAQSKVLEEGIQRFRLLLCDLDFNIISERTRDTMGVPFPFYIDSYEGRTQILGTIFGISPVIFYSNYSNADPNPLPPIQIKRSEPNNTFFITSMNINKRNGNMLVFYHGGITELDTNLTQSFRLSYNDVHTSFHGSIIGIGNNYFTHGLTEQGSGNGYKDVVLQKYDTLFNIIAADTVGVEGVDNFPFISNSMDYNSGELLTGGHLDGIYANINFLKTVKKFYLAKYDLNLNRIWYKEYGGDKAYVLDGLKIINNKGCVAFGYIFDILSGIRNGYIMYVDQDGNTVNTINFPLQDQVNIHIVNPGQEYLHILNPDQIVSKVDLFDVSGNKVFTGEILENESKFNVGYLPSGLYSYILHYDGHYILSGKWIKAE